MNQSPIDIHANHIPTQSAHLPEPPAPFSDPEHRPLIEKLRKTGFDPAQLSLPELLFLLTPAGREQLTALKALYSDLAALSASQARITAANHLDAAAASSTDPAQRRIAATTLLRAGTAPLHGQPKPARAPKARTQPRQPTGASLLSSAGTATPCHAPLPTAATALSVETNTDNLAPAGEAAAESGAECESTTQPQEPQLTATTTYTEPATRWYPPQ